MSRCFRTNLKRYKLLSLTYFRITQIAYNKHCLELKSGIFIIVYKLYEMILSLSLSLCYQTKTSRPLKWKTYKRNQLGQEVCDIGGFSKGQ